MLPLKPLPDDVPEFAASPLLRAALLTLNHLQEVGPIGLTQAKALKRYFVTWAAEAFDWPYYSAEDLFEMNKVLNEGDFPPLMVLHELLLSAKLARHRKGHLHITAAGKAVAERPGQLWPILAEHMLEVLDHSQYTRFGDRLEGDWNLFLNIVNLEAESGVREDAFCAHLLGMDEEAIRLDYMLTPVIYAHILRPLTWLGLLHETRYGEPYPTERMFTKTALWLAALKLETTPTPASLH
jgi:hypothetical protein